MSTLGTFDPVLRDFEWFDDLAEGWFTDELVATAGSDITAVLSPGALTFQGQTLNSIITSQLTPGALTFAGQTLNSSIAIVSTLTPGAVTFTGQTLNAVRTAQLTPGG